MKNIILIILLTFGLNTINAKCSSTGMKFFPKSQKISLKSMFIIEGYALSQTIVISFKNRKIYLVSSTGELIKLKLIETLKGQMLLTQAIFKTETELKPNTKYFLKYSNETKEEIAERQIWNSRNQKLEVVCWETTEKENNDLLNPNLKIEFNKTKVEYFGCGPSANAEFNVVNSNNSEIWYKTEVIELSTGKKTEFYLTINENKISVGHGMCSGAFTYNKNGKYKARFIPLNADGKELLFTDWTEYESPFQSDKLNK